VFSLVPRRRGPTPVTETKDLVLTLDKMDAIQLGHYCNMQLPGPQVSEERSSIMRIIFVSNDAGIKTGFRAKYEFIDKKPVSKRTFYSPCVMCSRITIIDELFTQIFIVCQVY